MTYVAASKCSLCRLDKEAHSGTRVIELGSLVPVSSEMLVSIYRTTYTNKESLSSSGIRPEPVLALVCAVVAFCVVTFNNEQSVEPVFLNEGLMIVPQLFQLSDHAHDELSLTRLKFSTSRQNAVRLS